MKKLLLYQLSLNIKERLTGLVKLAFQYYFIHLTIVTLLFYVIHPSKMIVKFYIPISMIVLIPTMVFFLKYFKNEFSNMKSDDTSLGLKSKNRMFMIASSIAMIGSLILLILGLG